MKNLTKLRIYWPLATVFLRYSLMTVFKEIEVFLKMNETFY